MPISDLSRDPSKKGHVNPCGSFEVDLTTYYSKKSEEFDIQVITTTKRWAGVKPSDIVTQGFRGLEYELQPHSIKTFIFKVQGLPPELWLN